MSFGFSVGDFIAVGKLIGEITSSLQTIGGAKSEYQELIREFHSLQAALRYLDQLDSKASASNKIDSIKCAALSCRYPLEAFLAKIRKYEASLGPWSRSHTGKTVTDKLRWTFGEKDDVQRLQTYLNVHIGTINILLTEHGLERMDIREEQAEKDALHVRQRLDSANTALRDAAKNSATQAVILNAMHSMLGNLCRVVCGEVKATLQQVSQVVNKVCVSTQQIYAVVLEIRETVSAVDTRWTYFQAPLAVEDARGNRFPFPAEYDLGLLDTIIRDRFQNGPGASDVRGGNYELCMTKRRSEQITTTSRILPGTEITMAIIIPTPAAVDATCPIRRCGSTEITAYPGGGFTCNICCVWFDQATKERQQIREVTENDDTDDTEVINDVRSTRNDKVGRKKPTVHDQRADGLRNVRWAVEEEEMIQDLYPNKTAQLNKVQMWLAQQQRETLNYNAASSMDVEFVSPESLSQSSIGLYGGKPASSPDASRDNHSLQDYQMQLKLLNQQNLKRLLEARLPTGKI